MVVSRSEMNRLSICIVAQNEERNVARVLQSVQEIADEIIVVDGGSIDRTVEVARSFGARVSERPYTDMSGQKNYSVSLAANDWVFVLDADEELSPELQASLRNWKQRS